MSYEEKGVWSYLVATVGAYTYYLVIVLGRLQDSPATEVNYRGLLLWTLGISIGINIVVRILFEIARPSERQKADVRDTEISRLGGRVMGGVLGVGMVGPFALALLEVDHFWITNAIYLVFVGSAVISSLVQVVAYRRGF